MVFLLPPTLGSMRQPKFLASSVLIVVCFTMVVASWSLPTVHAQGPSDNYIVSDLASDVTTPDVPLGAVPPSPRSDPLDILELTITEPSEALFQIDVRTSQPWGGASTVSDTFTGYDLILDFQPTGFHEPVRILAHGWGGVDNPSAVSIYFVRFCATLSMFCTPDGDLKYTTGEVLSITLPKHYLTRDTPLKAASARAWPETVERGAQLANLRLQVSYGQRITSGFGPGEAAIADRAPDDGFAPPYVVRRGLGVRDLTVVPESTIISSDGQTSINVAVRNGATHRRLIQLTANALPGEGEEPWTVAITPSLNLAAGETANATLRLEPRGGDPHEIRSQTIRINATSMHEGGIGTVVEERFGAAPGLVEGVNRVFVHALPTAPSTFSGLPFAPTVPSFLSRTEKHPAADDARVIPLNSQMNLLGTADPVVVNRYTTTSTQHLGTWYDAFPGRAHVGSTPIRAHLEFQSEAASKGPLSVFVFDEHRVLLASGALPVTVDAGRNPVDLDLLWAPDATMIGGPVPHIEVLIEYKPDEPESLASWSRGFSLLPGVSYFDVTVDGLERSAGWVGGPRVTLSPRDARDAFVNPGRVTVFNVDLRNEDAAEQTVELALRNQSADWSVDIRPASRFAIGPQETVKLGLVVTAPTDAREGSRLLFELVAQRPGEGLDLSALTFVVVATSGVDIENETYAVNEDDAKLGAKAAGRSPGIGWIGLLAATVTVALARRTRNTE